MHGKVALAADQDALCLAAAPALPLHLGPRPQRVRLAESSCISRSGLGFGPNLRGRLAYGAATRVSRSSEMCRESGGPCEAVGVSGGISEV